MIVLASRTQTDVPISTLVTRDGGIVGLTLVVRIFNGANLSQFLDFNDGVFKAGGHVTPTLALPAIDAVNAPGVYGLVGGFNLSAITVPPAAASLLVRYTITAGGESGDDVGVIVFSEVVRDAILNDATPFAGADVAAILADTAAMQPTVATNLDATVSSRSSHTPADVDTTLSGTHGAGAWDGVATPQQIRDAMKLAPTGGAPAAGSIDLALDNIEADTAAIEPTVATNLDALVSSRATQAQILSDATPFAGANVDAAITSRPTSAQIDTTLSGAHGAGAWDGVATAQQIRDAMKLAPTAGAPAVGSVDEALDEIAADTASLDDVKITTARAAALDEITAARLAELDAANLPADVDTLVGRTTELVAALAFFGATLGTPTVHTPTTVTAGGFTWSVAVVGSTITITRLT